MPMTKKDFEAVAAVLRQVREEFAGEEAGGSAPVALSYVASGLASAFAASNERFDRERFLVAARAWEEVKA